MLLKMSMAGDANDRSWFDPLARALERPAFQFTLMMTQDRTAAEEIVQEAFVRVFASRTRRRPSQSSSDGCTGRLRTW